MANLHFHKLFMKDSFHNKTKVKKNKTEKTFILKGCKMNDTFYRVVTILQQAENYLTAGKKLTNNGLKTD